MRNLRLIPFAKLLGLVFALLGVLAGLIYAVGGLVFDLATSGSPNRGTALAFLALIGMPLLFSLAGLLTGLVGGWLYNLLSKWIGRSPLDLNLLQD